MTSWNNAEHFTNVWVCPLNDMTNIKNGWQRKKWAGLRFPIWEWILGQLLICFRVRWNLWSANSQMAKLITTASRWRLTTIWYACKISKRLVINATSNSKHGADKAMVGPPISMTQLACISSSETTKKVGGPKLSNLLKLCWLNNEKKI